MRIGTHAELARRCKLYQLGDESASLVEQCLGLVAFHPLLEEPDVPRLIHIAHWDLVCTEGVLHRLAIHFLRSRPALWRPEDDHWPPRPLCESFGPRIALDLLDVCHDGIKGGSHPLMHFCGLITLDKIRGVAVTDKQRFQLAVRETRQHRRARDLVPV